MSKPVFRHLARRAWERDGTLAILVRRLCPLSLMAGHSLMHEVNALMHSTSA